MKKKSFTVVLFSLLLLILTIPAYAAGSTVFFSGRPVYQAKPVTNSPRILMIGNSLTYTNNIPAMVQNLCRASGINATVESVTLGGNSLTDDVNPGTGNGYPSLEAKKNVSQQMYNKLKYQKWDYVILQGKSDETTTIPDKFKNAVATLAPLIKSAGAQMVLYCTWAPDYKSSAYNIDQQQMNIANVYYAAARQQGCALAPSGIAFARERTLYPDLDLYYSAGDRLHPNVAGSYLSACCIYSTLFGRSAEGINYYPAINGKTSAQSQQIEQNMQSLAADVALRGNLNISQKATFKNPGYTINKGKKLQLAFAKNGYRGIAYQSSNPSCVTVSQSGLVSAKNYGSAVITATLNNGTTASCDIIVCSGKFTLTVGDKYTFKFNNNFTWRSSNGSVAYVNGNQIYAAGSGRATLVGTNSNGTTVTLQVTVKGTSSSKSNVKLNSKSLFLAVGKKANLKTRVLSGSNLSGLTYKSSNKSVATVTKKGIVTAKRPGKVKITITPKKGKKMTLTITCGTQIKKLAFSNVKSGAKLKVGKSKTLKVKFTPSKASIKKLSWKSSNTKVLTVSKKGKIKAKKPGTAKITATATDGSKKKVTVKIKVVK